MSENKTNSKEPEMYFYHSFPRRRADKPTLEQGKGLAILESIIKSGLLLVPEITKLKESRTDKFGETIISDSGINITKTCSFTLLKPSELLKHSEEFGHFALEFEIKTLRKLGASPVFYFPMPTEVDAALEWQTTSLLARLGEIQSLLNQLTLIEDYVNKTPNKNEILTVQIDGQVPQPIQCTSGGAQDLIAFLRLSPKGVEPAQPIRILSNALRAICGFLYPTEDLTHTGHLGYYRQREWRIIANMAQYTPKIDGYVDLTTELNKIEKERLLKIDRKFFEKEEKYHSRTCQRLNECQKFSEYNGILIIKYVRRVIVPRGAVAEVSGLLEDIEGAPEVVALETLTS